MRELPSGRFQIRYRDKNGLQRGFPGTFPSKKAADLKLARIRVDMDRGTFLDPKAGKITLDAYAETWINSRLVKGRSLAPRTIDLYQSNWRLHISPMLGSTEIGRLEPAAVRTWHAKLLKEGPGPSTTAKCYRLLRAICQTAVAHELIPRNPVSIRGAGQEPSSHRPMFTVAQVSALADAVDERWKALIMTAAWVGLRISELSALRREDVDLDAGIIEVTGAVKSEASERIVAIPPHIIPVLQVHLDEYAESGLTGLVFVGPKGGRLRRNNFASAVWGPAARAVGLPEGAHLHDCRGFGATIAARSGATTKELMKRLGHASPNMAMRYQRAEAERDMALAAAMSAQAQKA